MGAGHIHGNGTNDRPRASERTSVILAVIVGAVVFMTLLGAAMTWPSNDNFRGTLPTIDPGARWLSAEVVEVQGFETFTGVIEGEEDRGAVTMLSTGDPSLDINPGDRVRIMELESGEIVFVDFEREQPLLLLFIVYVVIVIAVAWWRGLGALLGLALAFGIVVFYTVPALFDGANPLLTGMVTGSGALFMLLYIAHGPNARTTTAYLGTLAGLSVTAVLAWWAVRESKLVGLWSEEGIHLEFWYRDVSLTGLVLCGVILAGLGVLNDVTVTQASAVWELRSARPDISRLELFSRGMRIGRDHIASTVYTIAFAYVGAALPTIMFVSLYDASVGSTLTSADIAEEIVRTLVGSIGLVLAVPLTTLIGAIVVSEKAIKVVEVGSSESASHSVGDNGGHDDSRSH
jgi:uncharacterized membrane protein